MPLANYTEVKGEVFDQDGMRKQSLVFDNYFKKRGTDYPLRHLILSLENVDLYEPDYYESTMFQKARYGVASLKYSYKNRWMLQSVSGHVRLEKGLELQDRQVDFTKLEISGYFGGDHLRTLGSGWMVIWPISGAQKFHCRKTSSRQVMLTRVISNLLLADVVVWPPTDILPLLQA